MRFRVQGVGHWIAGNLASGVQRESKVGGIDFYHSRDQFPARTLTKHYMKRPELELFAGHRLNLFRGF